LHIKSVARYDSGSNTAAWKLEPGNKYSKT